LPWRRIVILKRFQDYPGRDRFSTYGAENLESSTYQLEDDRAANAAGCAGDDDGTRRHLPRSFSIAGSAVLN
jgi:hypothetical protein